MGLTPLTVILMMNLIFWYFCITVYPYPYPILSFCGLDKRYVVFIYRAALATTERRGTLSSKTGIQVFAPIPLSSLVIIVYYLCVFSLLFVVIVNCLYCLLVM